jgi:salicylate hydroxylase
MAVEDAWVLARCLTETPDTATALGRYETARRERTSHVAAGAAAMQTVFHNQALARPETALDYVRGEWSPAAISARYDWIYRYDALSVPLPDAALAGAVA